MDWVRSTRAILRDSEVDFHRIRPWVYWRDMLLGTLIAYSSAGLFLSAPMFSIWQLVSFPVAVFWLYRVGSLVHEVAHLGGNELRSFKIAWNLLVGVPTLTPSTFLLVITATIILSASMGLRKILNTW